MIKTSRRQKQLDDIFTQFDQLLSCGWQKVSLYPPPLQPSFAYISPFISSSFSIVIDAGIHGNEISPTIALTHLVPQLPQLAQNLQLIILPVANPVGFVKNIRYINSNEPISNTASVGDMSHLMPWYEGTIFHDVSSTPNNDYCAHLGKFALDIQNTYPIHYCFDLHEDDFPNLPPGGYLYPIANTNPKQVEYLTTLYSNLHIPLITNLETRFKEKITNGLVYSPLNASFPEIFTTRGATGFTIETTTKLPQTTRIKFYKSCITHLPEFLKL